MKIIFLDAALKEFTDAVAYYNGESPGGGYEFAMKSFGLSNASQQCPTHGRCCPKEPEDASHVVSHTGLFINNGRRR